MRDIAGRKLKLSKPNKWGAFSLAPSTQSNPQDFNAEIMQQTLNENHFHTWLSSLPVDSINRLRMINLSTHSSQHVILTLGFGLYDRHIFRLNKMIAGLLVARMKADRRGETHVVQKINGLMDKLHHAIDSVTGVDASQRGDGHACSRKTSRARNRAALT